MRRASRALSLLPLLVLSCTDPGPTAGALFVRLATPSSDDGVVWVRVVGEAISDPAPSSSYSLYSLQTAADTLEVVVVGDIVAGDLFGFNVPDVEGEYGASVIEVASRSNVLRDPPVDYAVELHR